MSSEVEKGYTFRMGDHEITMRDSFSSMFDSKQLTDCILVCPQPHDQSIDGNESHDNNSTNNQLINGHSSTISKAISRAQTSRNESISDQNSRIVRTHRVILSASSDFFRSVFAAINNLNAGVVAVIVSNVDFEDLDSIVEFIYKGQVSVGETRIHKFLKAAQLLMVKGLMNIKLVSNDNQPIDENTNSEQEINKLKNEKKILEQEIKALKDIEKLKSDRNKREIEEEVKKKLELEKSVLSEEKKRFEAEKMKFIIDKEVFEKSKAINKLTNDNKSQELNKQQNQTERPEFLTPEPSQSIREEVTNNESQESRQLSSPTKTAQSERIIGAQQISSSQKSSDSTHSSPVKRAVNHLESPIETEGRQLRKRTKTTPNEETNDSLRRTPKTSDISKIEEDEDGEIYEVDFSGLVAPNSQHKPQDSNVGEARQRFSAALVGGSNSNDNNTNTNSNVSQSPSSRAIVASTLAYHHSIAQTTPTQIGSTRTLRRSTSSHGSASTQSISGENGAEGESQQRRKGPGRTPHWLKEQENAESREVSSETRTRKQRLSQDVARQAGTLYSCPYCPQVYHGNQSMQDHINGIHLNSKQQYICDFCGKVYTWRISLNKHLKTVHPNEHQLD